MELLSLSSNSLFRDQNQQEKFSLYSFGKLYPLINTILPSLKLKKSNWAANWQNAINSQENDNSILSLITIYNYWKQNQLYYKLPKNQIKIYGKMKFHDYFFALIGKLQKNNFQENIKITMVLQEIFRFFYTKFPTIKEFITFFQQINDIIEFTKKFISLQTGVSTKDEATLLRIEQFQCVKEQIVNFIMFLLPFDGVQPNQKQVKQLAQEVFAHILKQKYVYEFLQTFNYLKIHFLFFFQTYYEQQFSDHLKKQRQARKIRSISNKVQQVEMKVSYIESPWQFIRYLIRDATNSTINNKKYIFCFIRPLLKYLPQFFLSYKSDEHKEFITQKIFTQIFVFLNNLYLHSKENYIREYSQRTQLNMLDLVRAFRQTNFLNNMQAGLAGLIEYEIKQHKQVEHYRDEYNQILDYFKMITGLKTRMIQLIEQIYDTFVYVWPGLKQQNKDRDKEQTQKSKSQLEKQALNLSRTNYLTQKQSLEASIKMNQGYRSPIVNQQQIMKQKSKSNPLKKKNKKQQMSQIKQVDEQDEQEDNLQKSRRISKQKKKETISRTRKSKKHKQLKSGTDQSQQQTAEQINMQPLSKNRSQSLTKKQLQKSNSSSKSINQSQQSISQQQSQLFQDDKQINQNPIYMFRSNDLGTYYDHHSHPYQSMDLLSQYTSTHKKIQNTNNNDYIPLLQHTQIRYPSFFNITTIFNQIITQKPKQNIVINHKHDNKIQQNLPASQRQTYRKSYLKNMFTQTFLKKKFYRQGNKLSKKDQQTYHNSFKQQQKAHQQIFHYNFQQFCSPVYNYSIKIPIFPLGNTDIGKQSIKSLTKCLQLFLIKFIKIQKRQKLRIINPFNKQKISPQFLFILKIDSIIQDEIMDYFLALLFELLTILNSIKHFNCLDYFHKTFFQTLQVSNHSLLLYYIFQIQKYDFFYFKQMVQTFLAKSLTPQQLVNILNFNIKTCKLINSQMNYFYQKLYVVLSERICDTIKSVSHSLKEDMVQKIKKKDKKQTETIRKKEIKSYEKSFQSIKRQFYINFNQFIDMLNIWLIITASATTQPSRFDYKIVLGFYCVICTGIQFMSYSSRQEYNYQNIFCKYCSNSVLSRFQIIRCSQKLKKSAYNYKREVMKVLTMAKIRINKCMSQNSWNVPNPNYAKYKMSKSLKSQIMQIQGDEIKYQNRNINPLNPHQTYKQRIQRLHQQRKIQNQNKQSNNKKQTIINNNSSSYDSNNNKSIKIDKNKKPSSDLSQKLTQSQRKNPQQQKQQQNQQYCYNNCQIFIAYVKYVQVLINKCIQC